MLRILLVVGMGLFSLNATAHVTCKSDSPKAKVEAGVYWPCQNSEYKTFGSQQIEYVTLRLTSSGNGVSSVHTLKLENLPASMNRLQNYANKDYFTNPFVVDKIKAALPGGVDYKIEGIVEYKTAGEFIMTERPPKVVHGSGGAIPPTMPPFNPDAAKATGAH